MGGVVIVSDIIVGHTCSDLRKNGSHSPVRGAQSVQTHWMLPMVSYYSLPMQRVVDRQLSNKRCF